MAQLVVDNRCPGICKTANVALVLSPRRKWTLLHLNLEFVFPCTQIQFLQIIAEFT